MSPKLLGIGLLGLTVTAVGAAYFVRQPEPVSTPAVVASSTESATSQTPQRSPEPVASAAPERSITAPAPTPRNATTVAVRQPAAEPAASPAKTATEPVEPTLTPPPTVSVEPPAQSAPVAAPEVQKPRFEEVTVAAESVLGVSLESTISSETAKIEDRVNARVSRDVLVDGKVAVPSGARLEGVVTEVTRGGKFKERPRVGVTFQTLILADGTKISLTTDPVYREGDAPSNVNAKVGGSGVVGAILGAMIGGKKGAVLGGAAGAAGGAAVVATGNRAEVQLLSGSPLTVRLRQPITVLVERHHEEPNVPR